MKTAFLSPFEAMYGFRKLQVSSRTRAISLFSLDEALRLLIKLAKIVMLFNDTFKTPNLQEADQLAIYVRGRGVERGATKNNTSCS